MRGVKAVWSDWLPEYNEELLKKYNKGIKNIKYGLEEDGAIVTAERMMKYRAKFTETELHSIDYTAHRKEERRKARKYYKDNYTI